MATKKARPAVVLKGSAQRWQMVMNAKRVSDAIGADALANFYRCFAAADRLIALEHLMFLNVRHLDRDSVASERNMHHLVLLLASAMYEAGDALQRLTSTRFGQTLQMLRSWRPLSKMRKEWNKDEFAATIRNNLGHHFGDTAAYTLGIAKGRKRPVLETGTGGLLIDSRCVAPLDALFVGLHVTRRQMRTFVKKSRDAHTRYSTLLRVLFYDVLAKHDLMPARANPRARLERK